MRRNHLRATGRTLFRWILLGVLVAAGGCVTRDVVTGRKTRNLFSIKDDIEIGSGIYKDFLKEMRKEGVPVDADPRQVQRIRTIVSRIAAVSHLPNLPYEAALFHTNIVNAMAMPGGKIVVFDGLWDKKEGIVADDEELAAILGHEIAHVTCRHSTEEMTWSLPVELVLAGVGIYAQCKGNDDLAAATGAAFLVYRGLWIPKYSRVNELEADRVGTFYMARVGYDPRAAVRLWKKVSEKEGSGWPVLSIFSTHPPHDKRYKELEKILPEALKEYSAATGKPLPAGP